MLIKVLKTVVAFLIVGGLAIGFGRAITSNLSEISKAGSIPEPQIVRVIRAVNGDTLVVRYFSGHVGQVKYIGLSSPKKNSDGPDCFAAEAKNMNRQLTAGQQLRLVADHERRDSHGRLLVYAYRKRDGLFINGELVKQGFALATTTPPNTSQAIQLRRLATKARIKNRGLWGRCRARKSGPGLVLPN